MTLPRDREATVLPQPGPVEWPESVVEAVEWHFAALISGNNQPHMSGDPRNRLHPGQRRRLTDAAREAMSCHAVLAHIAAREAAARAQAFAEAALAAQNLVSTITGQTEPGFIVRDAIRTLAQREGGA